MDNEQLVVNRLVARAVVEEIADRHEHFPLRRAEVEERQRLPHLDVNAPVDSGTRCEVAAHEAVTDVIEHHQSCRGLWHVRFNRSCLLMYALGSCATSLTR